MKTEECFEDLGGHLITGQQVVFSVINRQPIRPKTQSISALLSHGRGVLSRNHWPFANRTVSIVFDFSCKNSYIP